MATAPSSATVLVVDDDLGLLRLIQRALEREGFKVAAASSGQQAIAWLAKHRADLLMVDLKLQDIGGRELISRLASDGGTHPFIVITGQGDERVAVEMMKSGALDYLVKDVKFIELVPAVVRRTLARLADEKRLAEAEKAVFESQSMMQAVLTSLSAQIAVLDQKGNIVMVNEAWERFAQENGAVSLERSGVGTNYLATCDRAAANGEPRAVDILAGIRAVLDHSAAHYHAEYPCHSPDQQRWFAMTVTPLANPRGGAVVSHTDISERKRLERELVDISEREQRKFGHDMHDGLGQRLSGLEMMSYGLFDDLKKLLPALSRQAEKLNRELRETVTQARLISHSLAPVPMKGEGLMQGLMQLAASTSLIPKVSCRFTCDPPVNIEDVATATHLYRIAQEAVNNALKHGGARQIEITLTENAEGRELVIANDGRAIPAAGNGRRGMGLNVMRYRAGAIGATLSIESGKRKGVRVICTLRKTT